MGESKFKVGDVVRRTLKSNDPRRFGRVGEEYTVLKVTAGGIVVVPGEGDADDFAFELVSRPITIETGKFYRNGHGGKRGPAIGPDSGGDYNVGGSWFRSNGVFVGLDCYPDDTEHLVAEWVDEQPATPTHDSASTAGFTVPLFEEAADDPTKRRLKVGDRIVSTSDDITGWNTGVIVIDDESDVPFLIRFDVVGFGHGEGGNEWWLSEAEVALLGEDAANDNTVIVPLTLDATNFREELDAVIAKLERALELKRQLAA